MKKVIYLALTILIFACGGDDEQQLEQNIYTIEGKWLLENAGGSDLPPNTMFEFQNGLRYTYYCDTSDCDTTYWNNLNIDDAVPNPLTYAFEENILTIDGDMLFDIQLNCDGNIINIQFTNSAWQWWRIGADLNSCN